MTVKPLSQKLERAIKTEQDLDQMFSGESDKGFAKRVQNFIEKMETKSTEQNILVCSHSDWLSVALHSMATDDPDLSFHMFACASYLKFKFEDGLWKAQ